MDRLAGVCCEGRDIVRGCRCDHSVLRHVLCEYHAVDHGPVRPCSFPLVRRLSRATGRGHLGAPHSHAVCSSVTAESLAITRLAASTAVLVGREAARGIRPRLTGSHRLERAAARFMVCSDRPGRPTRHSWPWALLCPVFCLGQARRCMNGIVGCALCTRRPRGSRMRGDERVHSHTTPRPHLSVQHTPAP